MADFLINLSERRGDPRSGWDSLSESVLSYLSSVKLFSYAFLSANLSWIFKASFNHKACFMRATFVHLLGDSAKIEIIFQIDSEKKF